MGNLRLHQVRLPAGVRGGRGGVATVSRPRRTGVALAWRAPHSRREHHSATLPLTNRMLSMYAVTSYTYLYIVLFLYILDLTI